MKISFITTVFNEERTIHKFLESLLLQTKLPNDIIIVDGKSTDATVEKIKNYDLRFKKKKVRFKVLIKRGNRSVGRNEAIENATGDVITCSDSGNILDKNWIKNIVAPFKDKTVDVVAGYYKGKAKNIFQKCLIPYALVMPDKVDPQNFLPATRSIAFTKQIWKKVGRFDEKYSHNEDYVFANKLKVKKAKIVFAKDAIVNWIPRNTFKQAFVMFFRFALGDAEAGIWRWKVLFLFARYFLGLSLLLLSFLYQSLLLAITLIIFILAYIVWSIKKNYRYIQNPKALITLPLIQFTADAAVLSGSVVGILRKISNFIAENKFLSFLLVLYTTFVLATLSWGLPNPSHAFPYHMDEWHQFMAIKAIIKYGTTTISGSAEIPFVYPVLSGIYLGFFTLFKAINPFILRSPVEDLLLQQKIFEILRSVNIFFGIGSVLLMVKIAKDYLKVNSHITAFFFIICPSFLLLSTYFKYDICLLFWIIASLWLMLRYSTKPTLKNYVFAAIASAVAMGTKFSAAPLVPLLVFAFIWFSPQKKQALKYFVIGGLVYLATFLVVGMPSVFIGKANYAGLLYANLINTPNETANFLLPYPWWGYLLINQFPLLFGHALFFLSAASSIMFLFLLLGNKLGKIKNNKVITFIFVGLLLFALSLVTLKIWATRNRALVLLPFLVLTTAWFIAYLQVTLRRYYKLTFTIVISLLIVLQIAQTGAWLYAKYGMDPQKESSLWIKNNVPKGTTIGVENVVLYQGLPNIIVQEFYLHQYQKPNNNLFTYEVITEKSHKLPSVIVLSEADTSPKLYISTPKNEIIKRLEREGYKRQKDFVPDISLLKWFTDNVGFYLAGNASTPTSIVIYTKEK